MSTSLLDLEAYQYTSLPSVGSTFRLLKLLKYQGPELECELLQQSLLNDGHTPYEALSYVWGSNELVECILLDRKRLWVTDNLYSALHGLRLRDRDRFLWIDAICINQADKEEQSQQVRQMGTIYKLAKGVLFWLGKATSEIIALMDALRQLQRTGAEWDFKQSMPDSHRLNDYRTGLRQLLGRQWFTRVWILQEVANAQKGTVCCGTWTIPANIFAQAPSLMGVEPEPHCQAILDILPETSRSRSWWGQERDLCMLLCKFQASKATDERDKIYALLGLSSNPLDINSINVDYQQPAYKVIQKTITYLMQSTPISISEILNLMDSFVTLDTIFFVPTAREEETTEILFPHLQSGEKMNKAQSLENITRGIAIVHDPSLLLLERRPEGSLEYQETCYSDVVKLMLDVRTAETQERQEHDTGLQVIPWGSVDRHVKLLVIHDGQQAILKAAMHSCGHIVKKLLHMKIGDKTGQCFEESALQEAVRQGQKMAIHTILQQSSRVHTQIEMYDSLLQEAARQDNWNSEEVMALLLDRRKDDVPITQEVVVAAAGNHKGKGIMELLLDKRGDEVQITQEVVVTAAQNKYNGKEIMALLLDKRGDKVQITQEVVIAAAQNKHNSKEIMALLLDKRRDEVQITQEVVIAAAGNYDGKGVIELLFDKRGDEVQITQEVVIAAAQNKYNSKEIMALLLDKRRDKVQITQEVVVAAATNHYGEEILALLLNKRGDEDQITQEVVVSIAQSFGEKVMALLLDKRGDEVQITQEVVIAAAWNNYNGKEIMALLLDKRRDEVRITQEVVIAAAQNKYNGKEIMALLLDKRGDKVQVTQEVVIAAAWNNYNGKEIMALLLDKRGDEVQITQEVVVAAAGNNKEVLALLLDKRGDEVQITQEVVVAAAGNSREVMALLLNQRRDDVQITQEVVVAAAQNEHYGKEIMALLLDKRRDEIQVTQEVIVAAAGNDDSGRVINYLHEIGSIDITDAVIQSAATSGQENYLRLFDQWAKASIVTKTWFDIAGLCAAAKEGNAEAVRKLTQQGVPPDEQDTQGATPLWYAAARGHTDIVRVLLETNAVDVNATTVDKRTPLFWPAAYGYVEVVKLLLDYGAQQNYEDKVGRSPLTIARIHGETEIVKILEAKDV
jgi:alkylhydroperoxidase family enzyme